MMSSGQFHAHHFFLLAQNGHAGFDVRRLQVGDQAPLEAGNQALFQTLNFAGGPVAGHHDLLARFVQGVEGVEEFLLDALLAGQELNIVDQEDIRLAIFAAEPDELIVLDRVDELVREFLRGDVGDPRAFLVIDHMLANGVQQVRFAQPHSAVEEERIVGFSGGLRHGHGGGVRKGIVVADDECLEGILGIERQIGPGILPFPLVGSFLGGALGSATGAACPLRVDDEETIKRAFNGCPVVRASTS